jgi:hypothetical protein
LKTAGRNPRGGPKQGAGYGDLGWLEHCVGVGDLVLVAVEVAVTIAVVGVGDLVLVAVEVAVTVAVVGVGVPDVHGSGSFAYTSTMTTGKVPPEVFVILAEPAKPAGRLASAA